MSSNSIHSEIKLLLDEAYRTMDPWFGDDPLRSEIQSLSIFVLTHVRYFSYQLTGNESINELLTFITSKKLEKHLQVLREIYGGGHEKFQTVRSLPAPIRTFLEHRGQPDMSQSQEFGLRCCIALSGAHLSVCMLHIGDEDIGKALLNYGESNRYYGMFLSAAEHSGVDWLQTTRTELAKVGAQARADKYSVMKSQALEWYGANRAQYKNKDDAAYAITKLHAVEFSTARNWLKGA